jgi:hypothetical protein
MSMRASKRDPLSSAWKPIISKGRVGLKHAVVCGAGEGECLVDLMDVSRGEGLRDKLAFTGDFEQKLDKPHSIPMAHSSHCPDPSILPIDQLIPNQYIKKVIKVFQIFINIYN